jgi:hypothetical protein
MLLFGELTKEEEIIGHSTVTVKIEGHFSKNYYSYFKTRA